MNRPGTVLMSDASRAKRDGRVRDKDARSADSSAIRIRSWSLCVVLIALALAFTLVASGCGGGGGGKETGSGEKSTATTAAKKSTATTVNTNAAYTALVGSPLKTNELTPSDLTDALAQHRPVTILFYVSGGADDAAVLDSVKSLQPKYPDVTFLLYDYKDPKSYGSLGSTLMVDYPPQATFIDTQGVVRSVLGGFVDTGTLNQQVVNIRQG